MRAWIVVLCILLVAQVPNTTAVDPLDDDAGSGADAGDIALTALPITPGSYEGHVATGTDREDWYHFDAGAGDLLTVEWDEPGVQYFLIVSIYDASDASVLGDGPFATSIGGRLARLLPEQGTYFLQFQMVTNDLAGRVSYAFDLSLRSGGFWDVSASSRGRVQELRVDAPSDVHIAAFVRGERQNVSDPASRTIMYDFALRSSQWSEAGTGGIRGHAGSVSEWVSPSPIEAPVDELPYPELASSEGYVGTLFTVYGVEGFIRLVGWSVGGDDTVAFEVWTSGPAHYAYADTSEPMAWSTQDPAGEDDVRTPILALTRPKELTFPVDGPFAGVFYPQVPGGASATGPDGTKYEIPSDFRGLTFYYPDPGDWRLNVGQTLGRGTDTEWISFDGVRMPLLGVAPEPWFRSPHRH